MTDLELAVVLFRGVDRAYYAFADAGDEVGPDAPWIQKAGFVEHENASSSP